MFLHRVFQIERSEDGIGQPGARQIAIADDGTRTTAGVVHLPQVSSIAVSEDGVGQAGFAGQPVLRIEISEEGFGQGFVD